MNTTALVAEFLLIGIIPFFTIVFTGLAIFRVQDLSLILQLKDLTTLLAVLTTLLVYLLGAVTHRLTQLINMESLRFLLKLPGIRRGIIQYTSQQQTDWFDAYVLILQQGSDSLVNEIQQHESQLRIFKSIGVGLPILAIPLSIWLYEFLSLSFAAFAALVCITVSLFALRAFYIQRLNNRNIIKSAIKHLRESGNIKRIF